MLALYTLNSAVLSYTLQWNNLFDDVNLDGFIIIQVQGVHWRYTDVVSEIQFT